MADPVGRASTRQAAVDRLLGPGGYPARHQHSSTPPWHPPSPPGTPASSAGARGPGPGWPTSSADRNRRRCWCWQLDGDDHGDVGRPVPAVSGRFRCCARPPGPRGLRGAAGPYRIEQLATDLLGLLDELGLDGLSFCGLSLGVDDRQWWPPTPPNGSTGSSCAHLGQGRPWPLLERAQGSERAAMVGRRRGGRALVSPGVPGTGPETVARRSPCWQHPRRRLRRCCEAIAAMDLRDGLGFDRGPDPGDAGGDDPANSAPHAEAIVAAVAGAQLKASPAQPTWPTSKQPRRSPACCGPPPPVATRPGAAQDDQRRRDQGMSPGGRARRPRGRERVLGRA